MKWVARGAWARRLSVSGALLSPTEKSGAIERRILGRCGERFNWTKGQKMKTEWRNRGKEVARAEDMFPGEDCRG